MTLMTGRHIGTCLFTRNPSSMINYVECKYRAKCVAGLNYTFVHWFRFFYFHFNFIQRSSEHKNSARRISYLIYCFINIYSKHSSFFRTSTNEIDSTISCAKCRQPEISFSISLSHSVSLRHGSVTPNLRWMRYNRSSLESYIIPNNKYAQMKCQHKLSSWVVVHIRPPNELSILSTSFVQKCKIFESTKTKLAINVNVYMEFSMVLSLLLNCRLWKCSR